MAVQVILRFLDNEPNKLAVALVRCCHQGEGLPDKEPKRLMLLAGLMLPARTNTLLGFFDNVPNKLTR